MHDIERVTEQVHRIALDTPDGWPEPVSGPTNVFLLGADSHAPALVNAGHPAQFEALCAALRQVDLDPSDIERVVATSWGIDVLGAAANLPNVDLFVLSPDMVDPRDYERYIAAERKAFRSTAQEIIEAHDAYETSDMEAVEAFVAQYFPPMPSALAFVPIRSGHTLACADFEFEVIATPGPADGHLSLYDADRRVLCSGAFTVTGLPRQIDEVQPYLISLERLLELDVDTLLPNRGEPVRDRGDWTLRRALRFLNNFMSNAPAAMHAAPTVIEFIERDLGHPIERLEELVIQMGRYKAPMDELVRSKMIDAEGRGLKRRYGVDIEDPRAPLRS